MRVAYAVAEAFRSMRRIPLMTSVAVGTIMLSLLVFGLFVLVTYNVRAALGEIRSRVDVEAFLTDEVQDQELALLRGRVASLPGVESVQYISKEQARERFIADYGDSLLTLLDENPLPASLLIYLVEERRTAEGAESVARTVHGMAGVSDVASGRGWVGEFDRLVVALTAISILIGLVVALASVFVISNTVKLTVWARREAIAIMKLVGATDAFVKLPFFIEGTLQGLTGGILALGILYALYGYLLPGLAGILFLPPAVCGGLVLMGALLGGIGSQVSLKQFLEV